MAKKIHMKHFRSISEFHEFIENAPFNEAYTATGKRESETGTQSFTGTRSYSEAIDMLLHGWTAEAKLLTEKFNKMKFEKSYKNKMAYDVVGYQASVPRYLQGIPTNMFNQRKVVQKAKIFTIVKSVCYIWNVKQSEIQRDCLNTLQVVRQLEERGHKVNLEVVYAGESINGTVAIARVRIKSAAERLNISKLSFPLVHPSMTRRLLFRAIEKMPGLTDTTICSGYGNVVKGQAYLQTLLQKNEVFVPVLADELETIKSIEEILK